MSKLTYRIMRIKTILAFCTLVLLVVFGCVNDSKQKTEAKQNLDNKLELGDNLNEEIISAKKVFYALPSPIETAMLLKRAGTKYNAQLLNLTTNAEKYTTTRAKAINFGIYGADLSYASLFSQTQTSIDYMAVSKKLADELGMTSFIEGNMVKRLETNINNRDSSMEIISDGFMNSSSFLKEAGRPETAALIIAGGWIEGLYIACGLAKTSPNNSELVDRIIDQKMSLITLVSLLESFDENEDITFMINKVNKIKAVYDKVQVVTSKIEPITNDNLKVTTLQAKTEIFVSDEVFNELCETVNKIRMEIVSI
ncbi:MAG: hypothetical protein JEZ09_12925 [Salinivirgaceae bacterium]|nr:hypothetical protein [Salinivirgaceae bacterium]